MEPSGDKAPMDEDLIAAPLESLHQRVLALAGESDDSAGGKLRWTIVETLRGPRACEQTFRAALGWCEDASPAVQSLGADVLGQFRSPDEDAARAYAKRAVPPLIRILGRGSPSALYSALVALGHLYDRAGWDVGHAVPLAAHEEPAVRLGVAIALGTFAASESASEAASIDAVDALVALMSDVDSVVRDWATTGLAQSRADTGPVRDALLARTLDVDRATRLEALLGLASRRDQRAVEPLLERLADPDVSYLAIAAAEDLADARCIPLLERRLHGLPADSPDRESITSALDACRGEVRDS